MARSKFRQHDLTRALKAAQAAGVEVARFEIEQDGKIVLVTGKASETVRNELDDWMSKNAGEIERH